jgi:uncharacterized protein (DUF1501 family)
MDRRDFLKTSSLASGYFLLPGFLKPLEKLSPAATQKNLIVIQLSGGNDWLNTIVPYKNDLYYKLRPNIGIKSDTILSLDKGLGMHPALLPLKNLFDNGEMSVVNNVGYPNPDRSHFRSMDIWQTASASNEILQTGWLGRYLDSNCTYSHEVMEVDSYLSLALKGKKMKGLAVNDINKLYNQVRTPFFNDLVSASKVEKVEKFDENLTEDNQGYLYKTLIETQSSVDYIFEKNKIAKASAQYPNTELGKQLKNISQFIASGLNTKVYYVSIGGFDTHVGQLARQEYLI